MIGFEDEITFLYFFDDNIKVDQSIINTNNEIQAKSPNLTSHDPFLTENLAFLGNNVVEGTGKAIVVRTGINTIYGRLGKNYSNQNENQLNINFDYLILIFVV